MSQTDDRRNKPLPVTAEIGSEGGSFADPTYQVSTFKGDIRRDSGLGGDSSAATDATRMDNEGSAVGNPESGMVRYPTEPPSPHSAAEGWRAGGNRWRTAAIGAAAGAALAFGIGRMRKGRVRDDRGPGGFGSGVSDE